MNCTHRNRKIYPMHRCSASLDNSDDAINSIRTISFTPTVTLSSKGKCHRRSLGKTFLMCAPKSSINSCGLQTKVLQSTMPTLEVRKTAATPMEQDRASMETVPTVGSRSAGHHCYSHSPLYPHVCLECCGTNFT